MTTAAASQNPYMTVRLARRILRDSFKIASLLSKPDSNPKVAKNGKVGVMTAPLHLAPANLSGFNTCAAASAGCREACLHTAGNPAYMAAKHAARINRTLAYFRNRAAFLAAWTAELVALEKKAKAADMQAGHRPNATSDIPFERVPVVRDGVVYPNAMMAFPAIEFYDYTKIAKRAIAWARGELPRNYHITFSLSESNEADAVRVLQAGGNVAVVFAVARSKPLPATYTLGGVTVPVINGDEHDFRPIDPRGVIVGLRSKGKARGDNSGFVRAV